MKLRDVTEGEIEDQVREGDPGESDAEKPHPDSIITLVHSTGSWINSNGSHQEKIVKANKRSGQDWPISSKGRTCIPLLSDELELIILARFPISEYWKVCVISKKILALFRMGELFRIRRELKVTELSVFMLASGETNWRVFDRNFTSCRRLPLLPGDSCFISGDKESLCAGTHLLVSGKEIEGPAIWRYDLAMNKWYHGPSMIEPRCLFASASCGDFAFVAGGISMMGTRARGILNTAEKYNPESRSWVPLPRMSEKRKLCSGIYMDNKFYVIGGQNEKGEALTCGEVFLEEANIWLKIPDIIRDSPVATSSESPPLVAVVDNELYSIETSSNQLKVYLKASNSWKKLGPVPVRTDFNRGWGVAFKSLGNELLVIGGSTVPRAGHGMTIYTCRPHPGNEELQWKLLESGKSRSSHFIYNCSVMVA
ncbi:hypothetical protein Droror1_Dr00021796 [Drosera rotundifolia]